MYCKYHTCCATRCMNKVKSCGNKLNHWRWWVLICARGILFCAFLWIDGRNLGNMHAISLKLQRSIACIVLRWIWSIHENASANRILADYWNALAERLLVVRPFLWYASSNVDINEFYRVTLCGIIAIVYLLHVSENQLN